MNSFPSRRTREEAFKGLFKWYNTLPYTGSSQLCTMADQKIKSAVVRRIKPDLQQDIMGGAPIA